MVQLYGGNNNYQASLTPAQQNAPSFFGNSMQSQTPFNLPTNPPPPQNFSHQNIAQFGSSTQNYQFYGQNMFQGPHWNNNQSDKK